MMQRIKTLLSRSWIPQAVSFTGGLMFFYRIWLYANRLPSGIDEGMYLYKGYLFAIGRFTPFQDYGPWTDHLPLSFLIPGYVQRLFGPGIRTGRYYAVALGILFILALWIVARRLGGQWWAAGAVWVYALNPALTQIYSAAASQILIATLLMWSLVFALGPDRPLWQLSIGTLLASFAFLSRINMLPVFVFLIIYIFYQYGSRSALVCTLVGGAAVLIIHVMYWPEILKMWAVVLPKSIFPFLAPWEGPSGVEKVYEPDFFFIHRLNSLMIALRYHFISFCGLIAAWLAWPKFRNSAKKPQMRIYLFLVSLYSILLASHFLASIVLDYCVFCFPNYMAFFGAIGVLLLIQAGPYIPASQPIVRNIILIELLWLMVDGIMLGARGDVSNWVLSTLETMENFSILKVTKANLVRSLFFLAVVVPPLVLAAAYFLRKMLAKLGQRPNLNFSLSSFILLVILGLVLSPTKVVAGGTEVNICSGDLISTYEEMGRHLNDTLEQDGAIFWNVYNPIPLLYTDNALVFPSQLSGAYSRRSGGDPEALAKYGFWNEELAQEWMEQAEYYITDKAGEGFPVWSIADPEHPFASSKDFPDI
jgi:hypothetical protein